MGVELHGWLNSQMLNYGYGGSTISYTRIFNCMEGQCPNPCVIQGSTVLIKYKK